MPSSPRPGPAYIEAGFTGGGYMSPPVVHRERPGTLFPESHSLNGTASTNGAEVGQEYDFTISNEIDKALIGPNSVNAHW